MFSALFSGWSVPRLINILRTAPSRITAVLYGRVRQVDLQLQGKITTEKLSGQVLNRRTGQLSDSVRALEPEIDGSVVRGGVEAGAGPSGPYAYAHEFGGLSPYEIQVGGRARALHWLSAGRDHFARSVQHPPAIQRSFMQSTMEENETWIKEQLEQAIQEELNKS